MELACSNSRMLLMAWTP